MKEYDLSEAVSEPQRMPKKKGKKRMGRLTKLVGVLKGGPGSGNFGHAGCPGEQGGSCGTGGDGAGDKPKDQKKPRPSRAKPKPGMSKPIHDVLASEGHSPDRVSRKGPGGPKSYSYVGPNFSSASYNAKTRTVDVHDGNGDEVASGLKDAASIKDALRRAASARIRPQRGM